HRPRMRRAPTQQMVASPPPPGWRAVLPAAVSPKGLPARLLSRPDGAGSAAGVPQAPAVAVWADPANSRPPPSRTQAPRPTGTVRGPRAGMAAALGRSAA